LIIQESDSGGMAAAVHIFDWGRKIVSYLWISLRKLASFVEISLGVYNKRHKTADESYCGNKPS
jgi:hypothetical protein